MIAAFGCGIGDDFDISKLRYDKIIILTDADVDGAHISTLLLTFFYRFMPELIYAGKIYRGLPPLYKVDYETVSQAAKQREEDIALGLISPDEEPEEPVSKKKKGKKKLSRYVFNDFELEKFRKNKSYKITGIQRYKGLGEMDAEQLWETTMEPSTRTMLQVSIEDAAEAERVVSELMGDQVEPRKEFIQKHAHDVRFLDF